MAEQVFNRCMWDSELEVEDKDKDYQIFFNYEFLDDLYLILNWAEKGSSDSGSSTGNVKVSNFMTSKLSFQTSITFAVYTKR